MPFARLRLRPRAAADRPPLPILLPLLIGLTCLAGAAILANPTLAFVMRATKAEARFVDTVGPAGAERPRFRFTATDGSVISFTARVAAAGAGGWRPGDRAPVYYDPTEPGAARLGTVRALWTGPLLLGATGAVLTGVGALLGRRWRRRRRAGA